MRLAATHPNARPAKRQALRGAPALFLMLCCITVQAGPPFVTDDPEPVELHHVEINLALQRTRSDAGLAGTLAEDINWGCARELQCHIAVPGAFSNSSGLGRQSGIGDGEAGLKYRFFNLPDSGLMAAVYPTVYFPTGAANRGLGNGRAQLLLPVWLQKSSGFWTWDAGAGYLVNPSPDAHSNWFADLLAVRSFSDSVRVGAEFFHRSAATEDAPPTTGLSVGAIVKLSANRNLLVSVGKGLRGVGANQGSLYVAYQLEL